MKPERQFIAERPLARHCPELLRAGPGPDELLPLLARMGERLSRRLAGALAPMLGGEAPTVACAAPRMSDLTGLYGSVASLAANSLMGVGGDASTPLLVSIEAEPVLRIVDRAFGGKGEAPAPLPDRFPMAADLMIARIEAIVADHVQAAVSVTAGVAPGMVAPAVQPLRRDSNLALLAPFHETLPLAVLTMEVDDGGVLPWQMTFALPMATLGRLFGFATAGVHPVAAPRRPVANPNTTAFGEMTLSISAVLVDMTVPFSAIAGLAPGQILPVTVARNVPVRVGAGEDGTTIAHGTIGTLEDRMAIQITQAFADPRSNAA